MLPPPPLPPMARPVAIIRSTSDVPMGNNSPPETITPPCKETTPADEVLEISSSPPLSPGSHEHRKSPSQRNAVQQNNQYSPSREYSLGHFHGQTGHVSSDYCRPKEDICLFRNFHISSCKYKFILNISHIVFDAS